MNRIPLTSLDDPRLDVFRSLKTSNQTRHSHLFVAEGTTLVERLFQSSYPVHSVLASEQKLGNFAARIPEGTTVYEVTRDLASQLVGYKFHLGVAAAAERKRSPNLEQVLSPHGPKLILLGDHMVDQQNVGMLIRIGSAFGAKAIIMGRGSADAFSRRVLRVSTGNGLFLPIVEDVCPADAVRTLRSNGYSCCATMLDREAIELSQHSFSERTVIVFGNETHGISREVLDQCDTRLTISMLNGTDSVNVAVAAGIFSHAYRSQHPDS